MVAVYWMIKETYKFYGKSRKIDVTFDPTKLNSGALVFLKDCC